MYFAIIDASSETSRLTTVAHGETLCDIAEWFADEFRDNYEMYRDDDETENDKKVLMQCDELCELARQDALTKSDLEGLSFCISDISVELYGIYDGFEDFRIGFDGFISNKPKLKKISLPSQPEDEIKACDELNGALVRACL